MSVKGSYEEDPYEREQSRLMFIIERRTKDHDMAEALAQVPDVEQRNRFIAREIARHRKKTDAAKQQTAIQRKRADSEKERADAMEEILRKIAEDPGSVSLDELKKYL